jgi:hypothetical protein
MTRPSPSRPRPARPLSTVLCTKAVLAVPCALALAAVTAACGNATAVPAAAFPSVFTPGPDYGAAHPAPASSGIAWPADTQVRAYLKAHPAPALPGMTAGIRSFYALSPFKDIRCGGARGSAVNVGSPDDCLAWQVTLVTATGTLTVTCGDLTAGLPCPSAVYPDRGADPLPDAGDYVYAPSDGQVTASHDVRVIKRDALS